MTGSASPPAPATDRETVGGTVAVVGVGLMGGSLARSLKALPDPPRVVAVERSPVQAALALESGVIDLLEPEGADALAEADVVVYATPLSGTLDLLSEHRDLWGPEALITDVAGLKGPPLRLAEREGFHARYVGAHPLCGDTGSGFGAARPDLYADAPIFLCAHPDVDADVRSRAEAFWGAVGGRPEWIDADEHDRRMAWVSHLPQLVANALAGALDAAGWNPDDLGPGGRDMTRLARSSPEIWKDLLTSSAPNVGAGLTSVSRALEVLADLLARRDVDRVVEFMERTRAWADRGDIP